MVALSLVTVVDHYCTMKSCLSPPQKGQKSSSVGVFGRYMECPRENPLMWDISGVFIVHRYLKRFLRAEVARS
jgi:hypothetical protein